MKIMVVGGGGREHAIIKSLKKNPDVTEIFACPGNGGIAADATCVAIGATDIEKIVAFAVENAIDYAVVAPDDPLVLGCVDALEAKGIPCFGPRACAAIIEGSKVFSKNLMKKYGIPTAEYEVFEDMTAALNYLETAPIPTVIKADGLAAGKGVIVAETLEQAQKAIDDMLVDNKFGNAGAEVLIEEFLHGEECSILAMVDGNDAVLLPSSQDHKRIFDGDKGPNTGGMGAYSPAPVITADKLPMIKEKIIMPVVNELKKRGITYRGILYAGLMVNDENSNPRGPLAKSGSTVNVVEFNARFGDPETEAVLPRLGGEFARALLNAAKGCLKSEDIVVRDEVAATVIVSSAGYPGDYEKGKVIELGRAGEKAYVYHSGTSRNVCGELVTAGGRVLGVTAVADTLPDAIAASYKLVEQIHFDNAFYRRDIGQRALAAKEEK